MIRQCGTTGDNAVFGLFERNLQPTPLVFQPKPISSQFGYDPRLAEMFAARYEGGVFSGERTERVADHAVPGSGGGEVWVIVRVRQ
jgi:hypothetical protein